MSKMILFSALGGTNLAVTAAASLTYKNLIQKYPMINTEEYSKSAPIIPTLSKENEKIFKKTKDAFAALKDKITFDETIITDDLKKEIPYNVDENFLKKAVSGIPEDTLTEKYIFDVEKNNDEGTINLRLFARALDFEADSKDFFTYTALLWEKKLTGFNTFSTEEIIKERTIGITALKKTNYMKRLAEECTKTDENYCSDFLKNSKNNNYEIDDKVEATGFIAQKRKDEPVYYIGTNADFFQNLMKEYKEYLNEELSKNNYETGEYFDLKKNHDIPATDLSEFFSFTYNGQKLNDEKKKIKSVRLLIDLLNNDSNLIYEANFVPLDLAILKVEFASKEDDPFEKWWNERPTKIRPMDIGDFLNGYDTNNKNDRPDEEYLNHSLEKGMKIAQPVFVGNFASADIVCHEEESKLGEQFKTHVGHARTNWKITATKFFNGKVFSSKPGSIYFANRADAIFTGAGGSAVYDKNLNLVGLNNIRQQIYKFGQIDDPSFCTKKNSNFRSIFQWFSFTEKAKDFFNLKDNTEVIDFVNKDEDWANDLSQKQINQKLYDYSDLTFGDLNKVRAPMKKVIKTEKKKEIFNEKKEKKFIEYKNSTPAKTDSWHWSDIRWLRYVRFGGF